MATTTKEGARRLVALLALAAVMLPAPLVGCGPSKKPPPPQQQRPWPPNVRKHPDGSCWYYPPGNCPPSHLSTCDAEVAQRVQCPY